VQFAAFLLRPAAMQRLALICVLATAESRKLLHRSASAQEPDATCGKGFDELVQGSQDYFQTAYETLWTHPARQADKDVFENEFKCWFALMATTKCGHLESRADARKKDLTAKCSSVQDDWRSVWKEFSTEEWVWFKKTYPTQVVREEEEGSSAIHDKQVMETAKELNKKEMLCLTLFTIDDECVAWPHIRMSGSVEESSL